MTNCPVFVAQGLRDDTVNWKSAEYIFNSISNEKKTLKYYEDSDHLILLGKNKEPVSQDIYNFIQGLDIISV